MKINLIDDTRSGHHDRCEWLKSVGVGYQKLLEMESGCQLLLLEYWEGIILDYNLN